jgi:hypothetical protein
MKPSHQFGHITPLTRQPGQVCQACRRKHLQYTGPEWPLTDHDQPGSLAQRGLDMQRPDECLRHQDLVLDHLHAPHSAKEEVRWR